MGQGDQKKRREVRRRLLHGFAGASHTVGDTAQETLVAVVGRIGKAPGTGAAIRELHGAPKMNAILAAIGGGTKAQNKPGMAGGNRVLTAVYFAPFVLVAAGAAYVAYRENKEDAAEKHAAGTSLI